MSRPRKTPNTRFRKQPYSFPPEVYTTILRDYVDQLKEKGDVASASQWVAKAVVHQYERETGQKLDQSNVDGLVDVPTT